MEGRENKEEEKSRLRREGKEKKMREKERDRSGARPPAGRTE